MAAYISGVVRVAGQPASRKVRAFTHDTITYTLDSSSVNLAKPLGETDSDPITGEYQINVLDNYTGPAFVVAFDDYGSDFSAGMSVNVGDRVHPTQPSGFVYECTVGGTMPSSEPVWVEDTQNAQTYGTAEMIARPYYGAEVELPVYAKVPVKSLYNLAASNNISMAIDSSGTVAAWGQDYESVITNINGTTGVISVACGSGHALALKSDGTIASSGFGWSNEHIVPAGLNDAVAIAAAGECSMALKSDGTVVCWGSNSDGQGSVPAGLDSVVAIASSGNHSIALKSDGTVVCWGYNGSGQCDVPNDLGPVIAIAGGFNHTVALQSDGTVRAWGSNSVGETSMDGLGNMIAIAAGGNSTMVARSDGWCERYGSNEYGQRVALTGQKFGVQLACGNQHGLGSTASGSAFAGGDNYYGECNIPAGLEVMV